MTRTLRLDSYASADWILDLRSPLQDRQRAVADALADFWGDPVEIVAHTGKVVYRAEPLFEILRRHLAGGDQ